MPCYGTPPSVPGILLGFDGEVIACRVQSHPSRREVRERLLPGLAGMPVEIIETDFDPPNPWYGYIECLTAPPPYSHLLIIQDDTVVCTNLAPALEQIVQAEPDVPICLFLPLLPMHTRKAAMKAGVEGECFVEVHRGDFLPVVAVLWPVVKSQEFLAWATAPDRLRHKNGLPFVERSDDAMGGRWMKNTQQRILATIPCLVEHPDDVISTIARSNSGRTALFWRGAEWDATKVSWTPAA